jgi:HEAT repeat protein
MSDQDWPEAIRARLVELDPRFGESVRPHPFAAEMARGAQAIPVLLARAEDENAEAGERAEALDAVAEILAGSETRVGNDLVTRIAELGTRPELDSQVRAHATRALLATGHPKFLRAFEARLASDDPFEAVSAAQAMAFARRREAVPALIELAAKSTYAEVQSAAFAALGRIGDARALEIVEAAFRNEICLVPVIGALGRLGTAHHLPLLTVTLTDHSPQVRLASAEAIADLLERTRGMDHHKIIVNLEIGLKRETEPRVAAALIVCLSRLGVQIPRDLVEKSLGM